MIDFGKEDLQIIDKSEFIKLVNNSKITGVKITEEERMMINTTRAKTQEKRDKEAWDANMENAVDAYMRDNQTRVLARESLRVHSSTLIRHVEAKRNGTTVRTKTC